jgi:hypothetical protein
MPFSSISHLKIDAKYLLKNSHLLTLGSKLESVQSYQMGAFEALEWAWHMLRKKKENAGTVDEAFRSVQDVLAMIGKGNDIDFRKEIRKLH